MKRKTEKILNGDATLVLLVSGEYVWLAIKTRGIGEGRRAGYGGGVESGENIEDATIRELGQEAKVGSLKSDLEKVAIIDFHNITSNGNSFTCRVHVFILRNWNGIPQSTEEMKDPKSYRINKLPFEEMMPADPKWLPRVLNGEKIITNYYYGPHQEVLLAEGPIHIIDSFTT